MFDDEMKAYVNQFIGYLHSPEPRITRRPPTFGASGGPRLPGAVVDRTAKASRPLPSPTAIPNFFIKWPR
jgi:hypothetical protein